MSPAAAVKASDVYAFEASHRIYYNTKKPVPIKEVILALQGLEGVLKSLPKVMTGLTGVDIEGVEFLVERVEAGSLIEDIIVKFLFKDQAGLDAFIEKMGSNKMVKGGLITAALAGIVGYGLHAAMSGKPAPNITANNNVIINIGAGEVNMTPEQFAAIVKAAVVDKKGTAESALKFIGPARMDRGSTVELVNPGDGKSSSAPIHFSAEAIAEAPAKIELGANERFEEFTKVPLTIRATNLDSKKSGWAGKLDMFNEHRLPIELDPSIDEDDIFGKTTVVVDAALIFREKGRSRQLMPARIYVRHVYK